MRLAFVRADEGSAVFTGDLGPGDARLAEHLRISAKAGSSSKTVILELLRLGLLHDACEWKFWGRETMRLRLPGLLPVSVFAATGDRPTGLVREVEENGPPDIIWVEGRRHPPHLQRLFALCPSSFKLVYSKDWKPWKVEQLERFDLCLVDEEWQAERVRRVAPGVACGVWDKLIDYHTAHYPLEVAKEYDLCCVAYLRPRKGHQLILEAMARVQDRQLRCLLVGGDRRGTRAALEAEAQGRGLRVDFVGEVPKAEVNAYVNRSRIGVMAAEKDAAPRAILEYLAADVPVVVNADLRAGARYVDAASGEVLPPERLHEGIVRVLDNYGAYSPRRAYLERFSRDKVMARFLQIMAAAGCDLRSGAEGPRPAATPAPAANP